MPHAEVRAGARTTPGFSLLSRVADGVRRSSQRHWRLVLVAMLALLHVAVLRGVSDPWARGLLLAHLGLLLLWQPFVRAEQQISPPQGLDRKGGVEGRRRGLG